MTAAEQTALDQMQATCATTPTLPALTTAAAVSPGQEGDAANSVTITVTNQDEDGTVTLSSTQPQVETPLTATLTDPDENVSALSWSWESSLDENTWTAISGAASESYTPVAADIGSHLRATASYNDGQGDGKSAQAVSDKPVQAKPVINFSPVFDTETTTRMVAENSGAGTSVALPVTATDAGDTLAYSLSGVGSSFFDIVGSSGQIRVADGVSLDYEDPGNQGDNNQYLVTVAATDTSNATDTIDVTISVTDVDEAPAVLGSGRVSYPENGTDSVGFLPPPSRSRPPFPGACLGTMETTSPSASAES